MSLWNVVTDTFSAALAWSWFGIIFAALPTFTVGLFLKIKGFVEDKGATAIPWISIGLIGGLMGEMIAVASLKFGMWWLCLKGDPVCHDVKAGWGLIVTVPVLSFVGSLLILLFTWVNLRIPSDKIWASVFRYSGSSRFLNWACAILIQLVFWPLLTLVVFRLTLA